MVRGNGDMLTAVRKVLGFQMTIAEWIGTAIILAVPYLAIGTLWSLTHTGHLAGMGRLDAAVSVLGSIAAWPVLLFTDVCMS
ncbi:hypothetical protein DIQ79_10170 [Mycolicibacterium smegmatis]|uniref:Uncharacterized protein n=1 Tax=Mycolicibacterium smegmatis (strain ATCC 700084 / mc(2)155) TaxID=246196 RepID=A0QYA4_MYCS2|nr:conserved hypothetical protein [Mycolicibacterium smegmatis MC2 155]TBM41460.1 hypothetical protein DIQ86_23475 [Mycolicibacterium smegmatis]TBH47681.1 hypothetical protein EYS45_08695 [Mycolicibacterium smegmatis MC2 155]TBM52547.1 hypothetical protein DIQ85_10160 [Mycolicibacterium smegmatis]TBM63883.1 hypothetical protein DIQ83_11095 [Mycolicibacterium smegmatis]